MNKLDLDTENFESRVTEGIVVARFKAQAMDKYYSSMGKVIASRRARAQS